MHVVRCFALFPAPGDRRRSDRPDEPERSGGDGKTAPPPSPDILLGPLFNDVQSAKLFADQKTFADAIPNSDPLMILADYRMQKNQASFDLRHFVELNFTLPKENDTYVPPKGPTLRQHIDGLWPVLTRSTRRGGKMGLAAAAA
ncbi:Trehalase [Klebsiella pneumoniae]|uniref:Trehalase n=1 Tax=Klebsiella pneumoniae TaxID=573 RepID=A0A378AYB5_KLEPN|nr:Trehalase [Klebsiella pneumoniae]